MPLSTRAYLLVTATLFGLVGIAHLLRLFLEGHPLQDAWFVAHNLGLSLVCGGLTLWAARLLVRR